MIADMMAKLAMAGLFKFLGALTGASGFFGFLGGSMGLPFFKEGGIARSGAKSLPEIPQAQHGLMTKGRGPIPAILHPDEVVLPLGYIREFFGRMSERLFRNIAMSPFPAVPVPALAGAGRSGAVNINLNIGAGNFDDPSYWRNLFRTKIKPAMEDVNYGRM